MRSSHILIRTPTGPTLQRSAIADTIWHSIELGVTITDAALDGEDRTQVFCQVPFPKHACPGCVRSGRLRDRIDREVADPPNVGHPTRLHFAVPGYLCDNPGCATTILRADISTIVAPRAQATRRTTTWIMRAMIVDKISVKAVARRSGLAGTPSTPSPWTRPGRWRPHRRLDGARILGVNAHKWKHIPARGSRVS